MLLHGQTLYVFVGLKCGHEGVVLQRQDSSYVCTVSAFGESREIRLIPTATGQFEYCPDCISKMSIQCVWCGKGIYIGEHVTAFYAYKILTGEKEGVSLEADGSAREYLGCSHSSCIRGMGDALGDWLPDETGEHGHVVHFPSQENTQPQVSE